MRNNNNCLPIFRGPFNRAFVEKVAKGRPLVFLIDRNVYRLWQKELGKILGKNANVIIIDAKEEKKTLATCEKVWEKFLTQKIHRGYLGVVIGGGIVLDMGGLIFSLFKRGVPFVSIPTTLLAQVDASIGGKLAVNFEDKKNMIGIFQEPEKVLIDDRFLQTLPKREFTAGLAELLKHFLIKNKELSLKMLKSSKKIRFSNLLWQSIKIKKEIVEKDPTEEHVRKILNFGHTLGHALESLSLQKKKKIRHGEAIFWGMLGESYLSLDKKELDLLETAFVKEKWLKDIYLPHKKDYSKILSLMGNDKKNRSSKISFSLLDKIGSCSFDQERSVKDVYESLDYLFEVKRRML